MYCKYHLTKLGKWGRERSCWWGIHQVTQRKRCEHDANLQYSSIPHFMCERLAQDEGSEHIAYQMRDRFECNKMIISFILTELILLCVSNNTMHNIGHEAKHLLTVGPFTAAIRGFENSISSETWVGLFLLHTSNTQHWRITLHTLNITGQSLSRSVGKVSN